MIMSTWSTLFLLFNIYRFNADRALSRWRYLKTSPVHTLPGSARAIFEMNYDLHVRLRPKPVFSTYAQIIFERIKTITAWT